MAPLPANNTGRVFLDYSVAGYQHTIECRFSSPGDVDTAVGALNAFVDAISPVVYLTNFVGLRGQAAGADFTFPIDTVFPASWGTGSAAGNESAQYFGFVGRSGDGRKIRVFHFGATSISSGDLYRVPVAGVTGLDEAWNVLNSVDGAFVSISGLEPVWHPYANMGINAYWRNKIR